MIYCTIFLSISILLFGHESVKNIHAQDPLTYYKKVPGANITQPINVGQKSFSPNFIDEAREYFNNFHLQMGGDHSVYYLLHLSEFLPTAVIMPEGPVKELDVELNYDIGNILLNTSNGKMTLNQYIADPKYRTQGLLIAHNGKIVYQAYPGMHPTDSHVWMSSAKTTVGLVLAQLEAEGKVNLQDLVTDHLPELKGTNWDGVKIIDALNMATGLDVEETVQTIFDPNSVIVSFF
ncbi:MAG: serine hydrolase [Nitrososphaeraceae archaeon]|nr:serine hydrolase [Nitrososphaeraceae archaeon]